MDLAALLHDFCDTRLCHLCGDGVLSVLQVLLKAVRAISLVKGIL